MAAATSLTRTSIYDYFQTREEIFLALLQREYERWVDDLDALTETYDAMTDEELADELARSLERRGLLLKPISTNLYDMEAIRDGTGAKHISAQFPKQLPHMYAPPRLTRGLQVGVPQKSNMT